MGVYQSERGQVGIQPANKKADYAPEERHLTDSADGHVA